MKNIKIAGIGLFACLFVFGSLFTWQTWAQDDLSSGSGNTIYLPWISGRAQTQSADASTDTSSLLKSEGEEGEVPLPDTFATVAPGQPYEGKPRPSQEELEAMAETDISPDAPYQSTLSIYHSTDSKASASLSEVVIIATVKTAHPASWNTPDGTRPDNPFDPERPSYIYTLFDIEVQEVLKGSVQPGEILTFVRNGGQVGEDRLIYATYLGEVTEGQSVLLYTVPITFDVPGNYWRFNEQYAVDVSNNTAINPNETRSLDELRAEVVGIE